MKQWIAVLLALVLALTVAGCGGAVEQTAEPPRAVEEMKDQEGPSTAPPPVEENAVPSNTEPPAEPEQESSNGESVEPAAPPENAAATGSQQIKEPVETAPTPVSVPAAPETVPATSETVPAAAPETVPAATPEEGSPRILIAYFTWADNTVVEDPSTVDVDASTSASVLVPGNAAKIANWIQQEVGGDLHSIVVTEPYSSDYDECLDRAAEGKADNARPALSTHVSNMEDYDIVFLGFPNWWYTLPMAVLSFVEEYDFSGKTIVPFCTHGTGGLSGTIQDLTAALPEDVTVLDPIGVYRPEVDSSRPAVQEWVAGLDLEI